MDFFKYDSYRVLLKDVIEDKKKSFAYITFQKVAEECGIQKTYLSRVMNDQAELNQDQLYSISHYLKLTIAETQFLSLLLEENRSANILRREWLRKEIKNIRDSQLESSQNLANHVVVPTEKYDDYFKKPIIQILHMSLLIERYRSNISLLQQDFGFSKTQIHEALDFLIQNKVIELINGKYKVLIDFIHLPEKKDISPTNHLLFRLEAIRKMRESREEQNLNLSLCFTADEKVAVEIKRKIIELLKQVHQVIPPAGNENVYQLNIDFIKWND